MNELDDWTKVDAALEEIGRVSMEILALEAELGLQVLDLASRYGASLDALHMRKSGIESLIEDFCASRMEEFNEKRSRQFTFGRIAFRLSEKIAVPDGFESLAIGTLKDLGWFHCVDVKETLNRNALKRLTDDQLAQCGLRRAVADRLRIEPNLRLAAQRSGKSCDAPAVTVDRHKLSGAVKVMPGTASTAGGMSSAPFSDGSRPWTPDGSSGERV